MSSIRYDNGLVFALVDCNNFYASCERVFQIHLDHLPVVVLSNNDGCVIARSKEAKLLGIPMGAPFFKWQDFCIKNNVQVFSSNYELYGDISHRVMMILQQYCPDIEIYSIDEAFLRLDRLAYRNLEEDAVFLREKVKQCTSIPISIGLAPTKTLAKIVNYMAKNHSNTGIFNVCNASVRDSVLEQLPVEKIWGIANPLAARLRELNIFNAKQLRDADPKHLRDHFSVTMEKMVYELRGKSCLSLETVQDRKQIISSRSFSKPITLLEELEEAVSHYAAIAALKLRKQHCVARLVSVFIHTNPFSQNEKQYANSGSYRFVIPTGDTSLILHHAKKILNRLFRKGYRYHKAGLMLLDIFPDHVLQNDILTPHQPSKKHTVLKAVDKINETYGRNTVFYCAEGIQRHWKVKFNKLSARFTTRWEELAVVYCN